MPWPLPESDDELLRLAKGYPYRAPGRTYVYTSEAIIPIDAVEPQEFDRRVPVIAHGSNRSPQQLERKFGTWPTEASRIPVTRAWLTDYDVVYSAHVTRYGSVAANLQYAPGARVELYVTWLDETQVERMHATELGSETYHYGRLTAVELSVEGHPDGVLDRAMVYLSRRGCLAHEGRPVALAASDGEGRHPTMVQQEALAFVRDRFRPGRGLDDHILETIREPAKRQALIEEMTDQAVAPRVPHFERELG